jgi:hypothetical protein
MPTFALRKATATYMGNSLGDCLSSSDIPTVAPRQELARQSQEITSIGKKVGQN